MATIFETDNFVVISADQPFIDRDDGGHIKIKPKVPVEDRTKLSPALAKELMKLTMVCGEAMETALKQRGIDIGRINYCDLGNWNASLHIHIFGRAKSAKVQKFGHAPHLPFRDTGFYDHFKPLTEDDVASIRAEIERLMGTEKYRDY